VTATVGPPDRRDLRPEVAERAHRLIGIVTPEAASESYPASTWRRTPIAGSLVSTRSIFCPASAVPSATHTCPAWMLRPIPTPPPWWMETQEAPGGGFKRAFRHGQPPCV